MCYNKNEGIGMENENKSQEVQAPTEEEFDVKEPYVPRPKWQVAAAWVGLVIFMFILFLYYGLMFKG